jgi:hypothetical protein
LGKGGSDREYRILELALQAGVSHQASSAAAGVNCPRTLHLEPAAFDRNLHAGAALGRVAAVPNKKGPLIFST